MRLGRTADRACLPLSLSLCKSFRPPRQVHSPHYGNPWMCAMKGARRKKTRRKPWEERKRESGEEMEEDGAGRRDGNCAWAIAGRRMPAANPTLGILCRLRLKSSTNATYRAGYSFHTQTAGASPAGFSDWLAQTGYECSSVARCLPALPALAQNLGSESFVPFPAHVSPKQSKQSAQG